MEHQEFIGVMETEHDFNLSMDAITAAIKKLGIDVDVPCLFTDIGNCRECIEATRGCFN